MTGYLPAREVIFVLPESHTDFVLSVDRGGAVALGLVLATVLSFVTWTFLRTRRGADDER